MARRLAMGRQHLHVVGVQRNDRRGAGTSTRRRATGMRGDLRPAHDCDRRLTAVAVGDAAPAMCGREPAIPFASTAANTINPPMIVLAPGVSAKASHTKIGASGAS